VSGHFGTNFVVPKCHVAEVSGSPLYMQLYNVHILKLWHSVKNPTLSIDTLCIYFKTNVAKFDPDAIWNDAAIALRFLKVSLEGQAPPAAPAPLKSSDMLALYK